MSLAPMKFDLDMEEYEKELKKHQEFEKYENFKKKISQELKEELRKEIKEELLQDLVKNETLHNKKSNNNN